MAQKNGAVKFKQEKGKKNKRKPKRIKPMQKYTNRNIQQNQNSTDFISR